MTEGIVTPVASSPSSTTRGSGGRTIGYGEFGDPNGKPVVLFHGFGDSRLTRYPDDELTARLGIRLITFDRPGIGLTDPMKELTILDRTDDVIDLVNSLGLQDISLLGWSGGAPYTLAAAGCMAGRVKRVALVSGFGPFERPGFKRLAPREIKRVMTILKVAPWMANVMATESQKGLQGDAAGAMEMSRGLGGSSDSGVLNMHGVRANVTSGAEEAFRQGPAGVANDMLLLFRFKWGFNPEDVHTPVDLWYGDDDHMTPPDVGRGLASILPQPRLRMVPGAGHLLYLRNWEEILRTLVADEAPASTTTFQAITPVAPLSPVTETLAAASPGETAPAAAPDHAEPAGEPVTAQGDVLGSTPAWSWLQPVTASQPSGDAPAEKPAEREPVAYEEEPVAPRDKPVFTPQPRVASASGDQLARLRALGFIVEAPQPVLVELDVAEPEVAEPEAAQPEEEPEAAEPAAEEKEAVVAEPALSLVDAEPAAASEAEAAPAEAEVAARPELKLAEPEAAPKRPSISWQPVRVPGLIIGKPRRAAPVEPTAPAAESMAEATPEPAEAEVVGEAAPVEPEGVVVEPEAAAVEHETVAERTASPAIDSAEAQRLRAAGFFVNEPEAVGEAPVAEVAPPENAEARRGRVADDELARLRAAGFAPGEPQPGVAPSEVSPEPEIAAVEPEPVEPEQIETTAVEPEPVEPEQIEAAPVVAEAEAVTAEVEAAPIEEEPVAEAEPTTDDTAPVVPQAKAEPASVEDQDTAAAEEEPARDEAQAVEPRVVEPVSVEPEPLEATAVEPETVEAEAIQAEAIEAEPVIAEVEAAIAEVEAAPIDEEPVAEAERATDDTAPVVAEVEAVVAEVEAAPTEEALIPDAEPEGEPVVTEAEAEAEESTIDDQVTAAAEQEPAPVVTELEEEASEAVALPPRESDAADRLGEAGVAAPPSEPAPAIAASAADAPIMKAAARTQPDAEMGGEHVVETGVGWVETVPMDVVAPAEAASAQQTEPDSPPEPMVAGVEDEAAAPAPVRDETMERLRAAGFLIGEPRGR